MRYFLCALLTLALFSCRPASYEHFIREDQAVNGEYIFPLDLSDSLAISYDISLYTRVDAAPMSSEKPSETVGLSISWTAPGADSAGMSEIVYITCGGQAGSSQLYRSGVKPSPKGEWRLAVRPMDPPAGLRGIGIICNRND